MSTSMNTSKEHSTDTASTLLQASQPPLDTQEHKPKAQAAESGSDLLIPDKNIEPRQQRTPSLTPEPASRPSEEQSNISTSTAPPPLQALQPPLDTHNDQLRARGAESDSPLFVTDSETKPRQQLATSQAPEPSSGPSKSDETISQPVAPMTQASQASHKSANLKVDDSIKRKRMKKAERRRKLAARTSDDLDDGEAMEVDVDLPPVPESSEHREHYRSMHTQAYGYVLAFKHGKPTLHENEPQTSLSPGVDSSQLKIAKPDSRSIEDRFLRLEQKIQEQDSILERIMNEDTLCKKHGKLTPHEIQPQTSPSPESESSTSSQLSKALAGNGVDSSQLKIAKSDSKSIEDRYITLPISHFDQFLET
ncbi:hypothetical protein EJ05DRAFT_490898 [Pseudovirgaria hyperparasitica]|uniref:Uncharacterized protein n=1 Tax=Pseudovirgaria hyperparasitica TaxID=470096 RepID=A0A6A6VT32_9PEZI|nr:uncharacterized protein EJ05DRAFT_490898 [Pseudovirgaria hyperparasitica]KAF2752431.1 hypothetical protein EJ05DRAFT_490898 [Pseudovirgaria hyperparasitica]